MLHLGFCIFDLTFLCSIWKKFEKNTVNCLVVMKKIVLLYPEIAQSDKIYKYNI